MNVKRPSRARCNRLAHALFACGPVVGLLTVLDCRQIVGVEERSPVEAPSDSGPDAAKPCSIDLGDDECGACMREHCCEALGACASQLTCARRHGCLLSCAAADAACRAACMVDAKDFATGDDVTVCKSLHCEKACRSYCGGWEYRLEGCGACMQEQCCAEAAACGRSDACQNLERCLQSCIAGDFDCYASCRTASPASVWDQDAALYVCFKDGCGPLCGYGHLWTCLGKLAAPVTEPRTITVSLRFVTFSGQPVVDALVRPCDSLDAACTGTDRETTTDASGAAEVELELTSGGFEGRLEAEREGHVPTRSVFFPKLTAPPQGVMEFFLPTDQEFATTAGSVGVPVDPGSGHIALFLRDCSHAPAEGLTVTDVGGSARAFYLNTNLEPSNVMTATSTEGIAGFYNVKTGSFAFEAKDETGKTVLSAPLTVVARTITYATVHPR